MNAWPLVSLADLTSKIGSGATPKGGQEAYKTAGVPLIRSMNVHDGQFLQRGIAYLSNEQAKSLDVATLRKGDVLLNITGASVGRVCCLPEQYDGGRVNQHVAIIRPLPDRLSSKYLQHCLVNPKHKAILLQIAGAGATREAITKVTIEQLEIPLPPLEEQKRIAAILDQADDIRRKRQHSIDRLNELGQAIFYEMFGDRKAASGWKHDCQELAAVCKKVTDGTHQVPEWSDEGVPFIFVSNVRDHKIDLNTKKFVSRSEYLKLTKNAKIDAGDVLYTCVGSYGYTAVVDGKNEFVFQRHIAHIKPDKSLVQPQYLVWGLEAPKIRQQADKLATGIAQKTVTLKALKSIEIPIPPFEMQIDFSDRISVIENQKKSLESDLKQLDSLFTSLQHRAFTGQL